METTEEAVSVQVEVMSESSIPTPDELQRILTGNSAHTDSTKSNRWADFTSESSQPYTDFWDASLSLGENYLNIINQSVLLPNHATQSKIAATYAALHSIAIKVAPILWIQGDTGTGKSALSKVLAGLREQGGKNSVSSATRFAALRNHINKERFNQFLDNQPVVGQENENPFMLVIADIKEDFLTSQSNNGAEKFTLLRTGWDRSEEVQAISLGNGESLYFYTFCPKIVTTRDNFILKDKYAELFRRCLFIKTDHIKNFPINEQKAWYERGVDALEPDMIDWLGCNQHFLDFWYGDNDANLLRFGKVLRQQGNLKKQALEHGITEHEFKANFYLMSTSRVLFDLSPLEVIELYKAHFAFIKDAIVPESEGLPKLISMVCGELTAEREKFLADCALAGVSVNIEPFAMKMADFKAKVQYFRDKQGVMFGASEAQIADCMRSLGFHEEKRNGTFYWVWNK